MRSAPPSILPKHSLLSSSMHTRLYPAPTPSSSPPSSLPYLYVPPWIRLELCVYSAKHDPPHTDNTETA
ncbi:hypothetical protein E2C01_071294 [Portunus trituberculatus]|uniref:Uncharacterized protein n=1 Tax=Portunus trituberculatus TaxID=210409 RepID=A0A5B7HWL8_PORTR|nr:hypothetical protein [Portunus trituberculatus]